MTGIRGSFRYRDARVIGEYGAFRRGAARTIGTTRWSAAAEFVMRLDHEWVRLEREGHDLVVTVGKFFTDPPQHAFSKIAGEVGLCIDVRSHSKPTLAIAMERGARARRRDRRQARRAIRARAADRQRARR